MITNNPEIGTVLELVQDRNKLLAKKKRTKAQEDLIDKKALEIRKVLIKHHNTYAVNNIIEILTSLGDAPMVVYDDDGYFAVSGDSMSYASIRKEKGSVIVFTKPRMWKPGIREALMHYMKRTLPRQKCKKKQSK